MESTMLTVALLQTLVAPDRPWRCSVAQELSIRSPQWSDGGEYFSVRGRLDDPTHVVEITGELDVAHRDVAVHACTLPGHVDVVVDLTNLTFMDCAGYGALVQARTILAGVGGSLSLSGPVGEPLRLLSLLDQEWREPSQSSVDRTPIPPHDLAESP
ncbi:MAG: STAS domain-containing protein [Ilumatobacteraceae bacterium]